MLIRSLAATFLLASSIIVVTAQTPDAKTGDADKAAKTSVGTHTDKLRDMPLPGGVNMVFLIKELARDMGINVLFDAESRLEMRSVRIELKNVTAAEALNYILMQEGLFYEEAGPKTILVASRFRGNSIPQLGVGITLMPDQLAQFFGVERGLLINYVRSDSPGSQAGLKAGDVIVGIGNDEPYRGALGLARSIADKKESDVIVKIVRGRKEQSVSVRVSNTLP